MPGSPSWRSRTTSTKAAPRKYPHELRERAIREVRTTGRPIAHVAKDLGIHKEALRGWVRQAGADRGERADRLTTAEQDLCPHLVRVGVCGVRLGPCTRG